MPQCKYLHKFFTHLTVSTISFYLEYTSAIKAVDGGISLLASFQVKGTYASAKGGVGKGDFVLDGSGYPLVIVTSTREAVLYHEVKFQPGSYFVAGGELIGVGKLYIIFRSKFLIVASNEYFEDTTTVSGLHVSCGERNPQESCMDTSQKFPTRFLSSRSLRRQIRSFDRERQFFLPSRAMDGLPWMDKMRSRSTT
jgi:hypothetical protein